jgi:hypothetical protein
MVWRTGREIVAGVFLKVGGQVPQADQSRVGGSKTKRMTRVEFVATEPCGLEVNVWDRWLTFVANKHQRLYSNSLC